MWVRRGNWTHKHRVVRERMISQRFKERGNIAVTAQRTLRDTNERSRKRADVSKPKRQLTKTAGRERIGRRGKRQRTLVNKIKTVDMV